MKRVVFSIATAILLIAALSITAFAYGDRHGGNRVNANVNSQFALCAVEDCEVYGPHEHDGTWYCNQSGVNWSDYEVCTVDGCDITGLHEHDGTWYHCANYPSGGGCCGGRGRNRR